MTKALEGIRVLLHGRFWAGPVIGTQLGDFGAEVIRFEDPEVMDFIRDSPPFKNAGGDGRYFRGVMRRKGNLDRFVSPGEDRSGANGGCQPF